MSEDEGDDGGGAADWYDKIEPGIRDLVYLLRNNGVNTTCSCEHRGYIECNIGSYGEIDDIARMLYNHLTDREEAVSFLLTASKDATKGRYSRLGLHISFPERATSRPRDVVNQRIFWRFTSYSLRKAVAEAVLSGTLDAKFQLKSLEVQFQGSRAPAVLEPITQGARIGFVLEGAEGAIVTGFTVRFDDGTADSVELAEGTQFAAGPTEEFFRCISQVEEFV